MPISPYYVGTTVGQTGTIFMADGSKPRRGKKTAWIRKMKYWDLGQEWTNSNQWPCKVKVLFSKDKCQWGKNYEKYAEGRWLKEGSKTYTSEKYREKQGKQKKNNKEKCVCYHNGGQVMFKECTARKKKEKETEKRPGRRKGAQKKRGPWKRQLSTGFELSYPEEANRFHRTLAPIYQSTKNNFPEDHNFNY